MNFNADSVTGVMTEIVAITCFCNDPARGIVNLLAAHAGANRGDCCELCLQDNLIDVKQRVRFGAHPFAIHQQGARHIRAVALIQRTEIESDKLARCNNLVAGFAVRQRPTPATGDNGVKRGFFCALLAHKPLQFSGYLALAHPRLNKAANMLRSAIGNPTGEADYLHLLWRFDLPQHIRRGANQFRIEFRLPAVRGFPTHLLALKTERLQLFIGNDLIDDSGKRVRRVKQMQLVALRTGFHLNVIARIHQNVRTFTANHHIT